MLRDIASIAVLAWGTFRVALAGRTGTPHQPVSSRSPGGVVVAEAGRGGGGGGGGLDNLRSSHVLSPFKSALQYICPSAGRYCSSGSQARKCPLKL